MLTIFGYDEKIHKCVPCLNAKRFCTVKKLPYEFISVVNGKDDNGPVFNKSVVDNLLTRLGRDTQVGLTMPQIFWGGEHIGGFDDLKTFFAKKA